MDIQSWHCKFLAHAADRSQTSVVPQIENVIGGNSAEIQESSEILLLRATTLEPSSIVKSSYILPSLIKQGESFPLVVYKFMN